jgi:hypothetical protein
MIGRPGALLVSMAAVRYPVATMKDLLTALEGEPCICTRRGAAAS